MQVIVHKNFDKDVSRYGSPELIQEIFRFIQALETHTNLHEMSNIKKLAGFRYIYRYRIGDYRIGFREIAGGVQLDRFLHRKDIYKKYP